MIDLFSSFRPDSRNDDAGSSSSGSTTLSATSSPGIPGDRANLSGGDGEEQTMVSFIFWHFWVKFG